MLFTASLLKDLFGTVALMALLSTAYGIMMPLVPGRAGQASLGALFGAVAVWAALHPLSITDNIVVDLSNVPLALAGIFLGWPGAVVAAGAAIMTRVWLHGLGAAADVVGTVAAVAIGFILAVRPRGRGRWTLLGLLAVAVASSLHVLSDFLLPLETRRALVTEVWPLLVPLHVLGVVIVGALLERERGLMREQRTLGDAATHDPLTGLLNRRGFEEVVARLPFAPRGDGLLVLDLDHFKLVNDTHGHAAGDAVLRTLGARLGQALRRGDVLARFGGEEFVVFLPNLELHDASAVAARLCEAVQAHLFPLPSGQCIAVTVSVGGAWTSGLAALEELLARADMELYAAKAAGRNGWRVGVNGQVPGQGGLSGTCALAQPKLGAA